MKRIALFLFFALPVCAQVSNPSIVLVSAAPSGSCTANLPDEQVITLGTLYSCQSGTWTQISGGGGGGAVSSVFGRTGAVVATSGDYTAAQITNALSATAANTVSTAVVASAPPIFLTGALCGASCNGTTTFPVFFHQPTGTTAATAWSNGANGGTIFGANEATGFTGNFLSFWVAGSNKVAIAASGNILTSAGLANLANSANGSLNVPSSGPQAITSVASNVALVVNNSNATPTGDLQDWQANSIKTSFVDKAGGANFPAYNQLAASNTGGTCTMTTTSCTITIGHTYTTPVCIATQQSATLTGGAAGCTVSGTTVTITAAVSNTETWGALVFGNPN